MGQKEAKEWDQKGLQFLEHEQFSKAYSSFNLALEHDSNDELIWIHKGDASLREGIKFKKRKLYRQAQKYYETAFKINPLNIDAIMGIVTVHGQFQETVEMITWFERAEQINPNHPRVQKISNTIHEMKKIQHNIMDEYTELKEELNKEK
jgi:tetratricopeptide (TPR) repeat protein